MTINYQRMRNSSTRMLTQNGLVYDVIRKGGISMVGGQEEYHRDLRFSVVGVRVNYDPKEIDGKNILGGDVRIVFTAETELLVGDLVNVDGKPYRIIKPNPVKPAAVVISYRSQLRA